MYRTVSLHINESFIKRIDQHAESKRRSRNSLLCEAVEILLDQFDGEKLKEMDARNTKKKKAGAR